MVSQGKNNELPDKDILRKYLQGKLPPDEAHRIEKMLLNNPLYQDALDGLETLSEEELDQDLNDISRQISDRTQTSSKGPAINFYRIAAAVILLAIFSYVIVYTTSRMGEVSKNETLSQKQEVREETEPVPAETHMAESDTAIKSVVSEDLRDQLSETDKEAREKIITEHMEGEDASEPAIQKEEPTDAAIPEENQAELAVAVSEDSRDESGLAEVEDSDFQEKEEEISPVDKEQDLEIQDQRSAVARTDEENLRDIRENDPERLNLVEEAERAQISDEPTPALSDYRDATESKKNENKLARKAERQAAKVYDAAEEPISNAEISTADNMKPVPVGGYDMYAEYIGENLKYPAEDLENKVEGSVKLRFIINKDSIPDRIRVIQSLSADCDKEAIRLLREGPKWIPVYKDGEVQEIEMEYNIYFQLED